MMFLRALIFNYFVLGVWRVRDHPLPAADKARAFTYSDVTVTTDDGIVLGAYLVRPAKPADDTTFFLVCHGSGCNQYSYAPICSSSGPLAGENVCMLFANYRGLAPESGAFSVEGVSRDIDAHLRYMRDTLGAKRVHLWGHALGAAIILEYARYVRDGARERLFDKVVLASTFVHFGDAVAAGVRNWHPWLPLGKDTSADAIYRVFFSAVVSKDFNYNNMDTIACVDAKDMLMIHSDADEVTPLERAEELSKKAGAELIVRKGDHNSTISDSVAWERILKFVAPPAEPVPARAATFE